MPHRVFPRWSGVTRLRVGGDPSPHSPGPPPAHFCFQDRVGPNRYARRNGTGGTTSEPLCRPQSGSWVRRRPLSVAYAVWGPDAILSTNGQIQDRSSPAIGPEPYMRNLSPVEVGTGQEGVSSPLRETVHVSARSGRAPPGWGITFTCC